MLSVVNQLLFGHSVRDLSSPPEEIKVLPNRLLTLAACSAERIVVEIVIGLVKPVTEAIISVFEVNTERMLVRDLISIIQLPTHHRRRRYPDRAKGWRMDLVPGQILGLQKGGRGPLRV